MWVCDAVNKIRGVAIGLVVLKTAFAQTVFDETGLRAVNRMHKCLHFFCVFAALDARLNPRGHVQRIRLQLLNCAGNIGDLQATA